MQKLLWLSLAGALGTLARYLLTGLVHRVNGTSFPWGTVVVNVFGCFLFGLIWTLAEERLLLSAETRSVILIGFMGAFTTFSTFMYETNALLRDAQWALAAANVLGQNIVALAGLLLGLATARAL